LKSRKHRILFKPLTIIVPAEREALYKKIKEHKAEADLIIENRDVDVKLRLKAMDMSVKMTKAMAGVLKNIEEEKMAAELKRLKKLVEEELEKRRLETQRLHLAS